MAAHTLSQFTKTIQSEKARNRFAALHMPVPWSGCWEWIGSTNNRGYGWFGVNNKPFLAHRVSYVMHHGADIDRLVVLHTCDNPNCVNPDHLKTGTQRDNLRDMVTKGRKRHAKTRREPEGGRATKGGRVRKPLPITEAQAAEIVRRVLSGEAQGRIGRDFGLVQQQVSSIICGKHWQFPNIRI